MSQIPVLIQILVVFALVVLASARKVHLGLAALVGGWAFALWRGVSIPAMARGTVLEILDPDNLLLLLLVLGIMVLSSAMKKAGSMDDFSRAISVVARTRNASIILTPMLIGTLPMPGGAAFSAPLVGSLDPDCALGSDRLSTANYWFRHVLELWWPLFPAFILTSTLTGFSVPHLTALNCYSFPLMIVLGWLFILNGKGTKGPSAQPPEAKLQPRGSLGERFKRVAAGFAPLIVILATYVALDVLWNASGFGSLLDSRASGLAARYFPILSGIAAGCAYVAARGRGKRVFRGAVTKNVLSMLGIITGIRVFSAMMEAGGAAASAASELASAGVPPLAVAAALPFVSGLVTGVGFGYVGLSLPIILGLFKGGAFGSLALEPVVVLAGAFGFTGMMISPLHVCMVVTAEHFKTGLTDMIRRFAAPLGIFLLAAMAYAAFLARVF